MFAPKELRTVESVRQEASDFFAERVYWAERIHRDVAERRRDQELGMRFVEAALALPEGGILKVAEHCTPDLGSSAKPDVESVLKESFRVMPYICGSLRLLDMQFVHATQGPVPYALVGELLRGADSVTYNGVSMTAAEVVLEYRRQSLNPTAAGA